MRQRVALFLPNWIGDVTMATPCLRALRTHFGADAEMIGVARPYVADVLVGAPWLDRLVRYERRPHGDAETNWGLVRRFRSERIDLALLLTNSLRTGLLAWLGGARRRVGYARDARRWLLTDSLPPPRERGSWTPISAVDYYLGLARHVGCSALDRRLELACAPEEEALAEAAWERLGLTSGEPVVAFHAAGGGGGTATAKAWPVEHFGALAARIIADFGVRVLVLCGPNERDAAREIVRLAGSPRATSLADQSPSIGLTKGTLRRCRLLVSTDSGPRHIATAFGVPTIGLFGATDPRWAETYHPQGQVLFNKLDCGPCGKKHCPLGHHACMRDLSVERVYEAVARSLSPSHTAAA